MANLRNELLPQTPMSVKLSSSILGLAICDALGGPAEFRARGTFETVDSMKPNLNFNLPPGTWTDDTSMTLCLAESIYSVPGFDLQDQVKQYDRWYRQGANSATGHCFDIGNTCRRALDIWRQYEVVKIAERKIEELLNQEHC